MGAIATLSHVFGRRQRFLRRVGAFCLVVIGVHAAADTIDDAVFTLVDKLDLWVDQGVWSLLETIAGWGLLSVDQAAQWSTRVADLLDVEQKESAALWLALIVEFWVDVLMLDFIWGTRESAVVRAQRTVKEEFLRSVESMRSAFRAVDLERIAIIPTLLCFSTSGALFAARSVETLASSGLTTVAPTWQLGVNVAAAFGVVAATVLGVRFVPDLIDGAILRAAERADEAHAKADKADEGSAPVTWSLRVRRALRGAPLIAVVLPIAVVSLLTERGFLELVARLVAL